MEEENLSATVAHSRLMQMLASGFGRFVGEALKDPKVIEIMLNPDGKLWIDSLGEGLSYSGHTMSAKDAERVIFIVASAIRSVCSRDTPMVAGELPLTGERFQGILPPLVANPVFSIRKKAIKVFTLEDYVKAGNLKRSQCEVIKQAVQDRKNILVAGGTSSGKTTLANAILDLIADSKDRVAIIEDTQELQCNAPNTVALRAKDGVATMTDLLKTTLRLRPDRIIIGEVRGPEALTLLKAWNTGHPGGCATVHADSARRALSRLEQLVLEAGVPNSTALISESVNLIVFIERSANGRRIKEVVDVLPAPGPAYELIPH